MEALFIVERHLNTQHVSKKRQVHASIYISNLLVHTPSNCAECSYSKLCK